MKPSSLSLKKAAPIIGSVALALTFAACKDSQQTPTPEPDTGTATTPTTTSETKVIEHTPLPKEIDGPGIDTREEAIAALEGYVKEPCDNFHALTDEGTAILSDGKVCKDKGAPNQIELHQTDDGKHVRLYYGDIRLCPGDKKSQTVRPPGQEPKSLNLLEGHISPEQDALRRQLYELFKKAKKANMAGNTPDDRPECLAKKEAKDAQDGPGLDTIEEVLAIMESYVQKPCNEDYKYVVSGGAWTPISDLRLCNQPGTPNHVVVFVNHYEDATTLALGSRNCPSEKDAPVEIEGVPRKSIKLQDGKMTPERAALKKRIMTALKAAENTPEFWNPKTRDRQKCLKTWKKMQRQAGQR